MNGSDGMKALSQQETHSASNASVRLASAALSRITAGGARATRPPVQTPGPGHPRHPILRHIFYFGLVDVTSCLGDSLCKGTHVDLEGCSGSREGGVKFRRSPRGEISRRRHEADTLFKIKAIMRPASLVP